MRLPVDQRDLLSGLALLLVGGLFLWLAHDLRIGSARRMGPGYFPMVLSYVLLGLGGILTVSSLRAAAPLPSAEWRSAIAVLVAIAAFAFGLAYLGLGPAIALTVIVSSMGDPRSTPLAILLLAAFMIVMCWLIFSVGLGMHLPLWRWPS